MDFAYIVIWFMASIIAWLYLIENEGFGGDDNWHNVKLFIFLFLALPATLLILFFVSIIASIEYIQERREFRRQREASKYGVFRRQILIEKYCDHRWVDSNQHVDFINRTKKFYCIKCKKAINIQWEEYRRLRDYGMIVDDCGVEVFDRQGFW